MDSTSNTALLECTTSIVSAYVANNTIQKGNLSTLIADTFKSLAQTNQTETPVEELKPAVPIKRSIQPDHIICLEDGKKFKSLKRHLMIHYNMTPQEYREKWGLPADYPMVAPNYALARSELAKKMGLGQRETSATIIASAKPPKKAAVVKMGITEKASVARKGASRKTASPA